MSKHTPGPWIVRTYPIGPGAAIAHELIGDMSAGPDEVYLGELDCSDVDARLIAAAPDLAMVLRAMVAPWATISVIVELSDEARRLLARIDGESNG